MLSHCVFLRLRPDQDPAETMEVIRALATLTEEIDGMLSFSGGPNRDYEDKTGAYSHGFVAVFRDRAALRAYDRHPRHAALGARLVAMCAGGADGIAVYDIEGVAGS